MAKKARSSFDDLEGDDFPEVGAEAFAAGEAAEAAAAARSSFDDPEGNDFPEVGAGETEGDITS